MITSYIYDMCTISLFKAIFRFLPFRLAVETVELQEGARQQPAGGKADCVPPLVRLGTASPGYNTEFRAGAGHHWPGR